MMALRGSQGKALEDIWKPRENREMTKRVCDLPEEEVCVGMRVKSLVSNLPGTITGIDKLHDNFTTIFWDNGKKSGFYGNDCECEIISSDQETKALFAIFCEKDDLYVSFCGIFDDREYAEKIVEECNSIYGKHYFINEVKLNDLEVPLGEE